MSDEYSKIHNQWLNEIKKGFIENTWLHGVGINII